MKKLFIFSLLCLLMAFSFAPQAQAQDDCVISSLPFTEGFENPVGPLPACFTRNELGVAGNGYIYPQVNAWLPHTGSNALRAFQINQPETSESVFTLIFPELGDEFSMNSLVLEFWAQSYFNTNPWLIIGVMDDPEDLSTFTSVGTAQNTTEDFYQKFTVYFDQYDGEGRYIAIKFVNTPSFGQMVLDDIVLDQAALCSPVQYPTLHNVAGTNATINWQPNMLGGTNAYNVTLMNLTDDVEVMTTTTSDTFYTFSNLEYNTDYRADISVTCADNQVSATESVNFSTLVQPVPVPYVETFEGDADEILSFYTFFGDGPHQWAYGAATGANESGHALYISPDSGATYSYDYHIASTSYAIFNAVFPEDEMEYHLTFDYKVKGRHSGYMAFDYFSVYMIDASDELTFDWDGAPIGTPLLFEAANQTEWTHHDVILQNVTGTGKKFILFWNNWGSSDDLGDLNPPAAIDNITIVGIACPQPNGLVATNVTGESALLSWNETGEATDWAVFYKPVNSTEDYATVTVSGVSSVEIFDLAANTQYEFYVVSDCGESVSYPSAHATFRTSCGQITSLPYFEDFESGLYTTDQATYIACWNRLSTCDSYIYVNDQYWDAYSGEHYLSSQNTSNCHVVAILPELGEELNANELMVSFQVSHNYFGYGWDNLGTLEVGVMTDPEDDSSFVVVDTVDISSVEYYTYVLKKVSLVNYDGEGKYIAFRISNCDNCGYYIDDVELTQRPACMYPDNFVAQEVSNESVTLTWTELGNATVWNIQYGAPGFTPSEEATPIVAEATTYTVTGLDNLTGYDFYLQADCGDHQSEWVGPVSIVTGVFNMGITGSDTIVTCEGMICDDGGANGWYSMYCNYSVTVYPAEAGSGVQIYGTADLSSGAYGYDESHLKFYAGLSNEGTLLADYTGMGQNVAVASDGPITVIFTSGYYTAAGFALNVSCSNCMPPTNVTVSEITTDDATISWSGDAEQYSVSVTGDLTGHYTTTDTFLTINDLSSNSNYTVQIRSLCEADSSMPTIPVSFTTSCDPLTITIDAPWIEDFESYEGSGERPFQCWDRPVVDYLYNAPYGSPFVYCGHAQSCHSGYNSAEFKGGTSMLLLPPFTNDLHELQISFYATSTNPSTGSLEIGVLTDGNDPNSFELIGISGMPGPRGVADDVAGNGNLIGPFTFSNASVSNGRIALRYSNLSNTSESWNLDDFVVEIISDTTIIVITDPTVATASASNIGQTTATLNANFTNPDAVEITEFGFEWMPLMGENYTPVIGSIAGFTFSANLTNLTPNTDYMFRAYIVYNGNTIYGNDLVFTTESEPVVEPCDVPTGLHVVENGIHNESLEVAWDAHEGDSSWNLRHRPVNGDWTTVSVQTNSHTITGLSGLTTYEIQVQAVCDANNTSDWSGSISEQTTNVGLVNYLEGSVVLFPNPSRDVVNVQCTMNNVEFEVTNIEVFDVYGKLITNINVIENPTTIRVSGLADGLYFVRVTTNAGTVTKTFVKQ